MSDPQPASISYLGHATTMLHLDGINVLTDPVLGDRVMHLRRRFISGRSWLATQSKPDVILLSHLHLDHFNLSSIRNLPKDIPIAVPTGTARWLRRLVKQPLTEVSPGDDLKFGDVTIHVTKAIHGNAKRDSVIDRAQGYLLEGSRTIYFPGDTDLFPEMSELVEGVLDLALLPIWGWGPTLGAGHMDPLRAAEALALLKPRYAIPIHWAAFRPLGFFWEYLDFLRRPGDEFVEHASQHAPETTVKLVEPGKVFQLP